MKKANDPFYPAVIVSPKFQTWYKALQPLGENTLGKFMGYPSFTEAANIQGKLTNHSAWRMMSNDSPP